MEKNKTLKRVGLTAVAVILIILLSVGTTLIVLKNASVPTSKYVADGGSAYDLSG